MKQSSNSANSIAHRRASSWSPWNNGSRPWVKQTCRITPKTTGGPTLAVLHHSCNGCVWLLEKDPRPTLLRAASRAQHPKTLNRPLTRATISNLAARWKPPKSGRRESARARRRFSRSPKPSAVVEKWIKQESHAVSLAPAPSCQSSEFFVGYCGAASPGDSW